MRNLNTDTQKQESPVPLQAGRGSIPNYSANTDSTKPSSRRPLSPRNQRLLNALLRGPQSSRDLIDIIPANNPAQYVSTLRKCLGFQIPMEEVRFITKDGKASWYGIYHLTDADRITAAELLQE